MGFAAFVEVPFECVRCGHRNPSDRRLGLWILLEGPNVHPEPGDVIEATDSGVLLRDGYHQRLAKPLTVDGFSTLDEWTCRADLDSGDRCLATGIDDFNFVRLSFDLVDQDPDRVRFLSAEQVRFSSETVASVHAMGAI